MRHEIEISVASYTLSLHFDSDTASRGTVVRMPDGIEASFSSRDCLPHLLEGMVGRRAWQTYSSQIIAALEGSCPCA